MKFLCNIPLKTLFLGMSRKSIQKEKRSRRGGSANSKIKTISPGGIQYEEASKKKSSTGRLSHIRVPHPTSLI